MSLPPHFDPPDDDPNWPPAVAAGGDGAPLISAIGIGPPSPVPAATPENFICLRGPCRYYWYLQTMADAGNPEGTWEALGIDEPRKHHHVCLVNGFETEFEENIVYECNRWDPADPDEAREARRAAYWADLAEAADTDR